MVGLALIGCHKEPVTHDSPPETTSPASDTAPTAIASGCATGDLAVTPGSDTAPLSPGDPLTLDSYGGWHLTLGGSVGATDREVAVSGEIRVGELVISREQPELYVALLDYDEGSCSGDLPPFRSLLATSADELDALCSSGLTFACDGIRALVCALQAVPLTACVTVTDVLDDRSGTGCVDVAAAFAPNDAPPCP